MTIDSMDRIATALTIHVIQADGLIPRPMDKMVEQAHEMHEEFMRMLVRIDRRVGCVSTEGTGSFVG